MHSHLEVILPPNQEIETAIASIMAPFDENSEDEDKTHPFWDFFVIGGRWAGNKLMARYEQSKLDEFYQWMKDENITVSGVQFGKQELSPTSQIPKVDAKWNEMFLSPTGKNIRCPIFKHSNDQYGKNGKGTMEGDIQSLSESMNATCSRVIFAGQKYDDSGLEAKYMLSDDFWNGVNYLKTGWDCKISSALEQYKKNIENYKKEYADKITPTDDWQVVTVDYHS